MQSYNDLQSQLKTIDHKSYIIQIPAWKLPVSQIHIVD